MRVGIRRGVIPQVERALGRDVRRTLVRTAALLREDAELLAALAAEARHGVVDASADGVRLHARSVRELRRPLALRIVRTALLDAGLVPDASHVEAVLRLASARGGKRANLPGGLLARTDGEYVRVSRPSPRLR